MRNIHITLLLQYQLLCTKIQQQATTMSIVATNEKKHEHVIRRHCVAFIPSVTERISCFDAAMRELQFPEVSAGEHVKAIIRRRVL